MTNVRRREVAAALAAGLAGAGPLRALAQAQTQAQAQAQMDWPTRPVKLIVPFAPGGATDIVARLLAERMQALWKQPVLIDYKPGGGTMVGTQFVATSPPDGYTLGMAITAHMINPALQPKLPYDTVRDLAGVSQLALGHFGLFAHPSFPAANVAELVAYVKKNPGKVSYATPGVGTGTHLAGEMLNHMAGLDMVHVPYKGSAPAQQDVIGGRVPLLFDVLFSSMPFVKDGRLKVLALSSPKRAAANPEIPLIAEAVPGFSAMSVIGVIAPSGVPAELRRRIGADIARGVRSPELNERMVALGMEPVGSSADAYDGLIRAEIEKWAGVVKRAGIKLD
ncbi:MAG: tripartite tricarboxylate transporter substrate binding protein [Burkholderiales bacterium]|nr:tripartite tricarboxylate transporter substrate binding protein [Burkholderiales bacterium]